MDFKTAIGETRKLYSGGRRGDAAARCALNEIEHWFICLNGWGDVWPTAQWVQAYQCYLTETLGNGPSRANSKFSVLRQVFKTGGAPFPDQIVRPLPRSKAPKWVLLEEHEAKLRDWLRNHPVMPDYMTLVLETGLRVEEVLRLQLPMLHDTDKGYSLEVPGTKTVGSYDLLPITMKAAEVILRRSEGDAFDPIFNITYEHLRDQWEICRQFLGVDGIPTSTLKALRRTFAYRHRHLPPAMLQRLLRHSNLQTTSIYLNVAAGNEDLRQWLDGTPTPPPTHRVTDMEGIARSMKAAGFSPADVAHALAAL